LGGKPSAIAGETVQQIGKDLKMINNVLGWR